MKNIILFFFILLNFKTYCQIEKIDTLIAVTPINFNSAGTNQYLDLDLDGIDDIVIYNQSNITRVRFIDISKGDVGGDWGDLNITCNQSTIETCEWEDAAWVVHQPSGGGINGNDAHYFTGNALITIRFKYFNNAGNFYNYKYALLRINKPANYAHYTIEGWYINHTLNDPLPCNLTYNDSIINLNVSALPVELIDFTINKNRNKIQLNWQTASEENNKGFEIQRSHDGIDFEVICFVEGNGTIFEYSNYSFIDENPINGTNYYKLKQIDYNGDFEYTDIKSIEFLKKVEKGKITPNPASDKLYFQGIEGEIKIYNSIGKLMITVNDVNENDYIDISSLNSGNYYIVNNEIVYTFLVIK